MGTTRNNNHIDIIEELWGQIAPNIAIIENTCSIVTAKLLGSGSKGLSLTTGTRLDMLRSLEAMRAACRSMAEALQADPHAIVAVGSGEVC